MVMAKGVGKLLATSIGYSTIFTVCAFLYLAGYLVVQLLSPKLERANVG
jgi:hypothetical protein